MHDPVVLCDGHSYERRHITRWLEHKHTSPVTGARLEGSDGKAMFPNHALRNAIAEYFQYLFQDRRSAIRKAKTASDSALLKTVDALMSISVLVNADMSEEQMLRAIVNEAKDLIGAEVASAFLVDEMTDELYSTVNSTGGEIRFPKRFGIAGLVATTGEPVVIADAYNDQRFNKTVDLETGFITRDILCVPIKSKKGKVLGVVQLINKGVVTLSSTAASTTTFFDDDWNRRSSWDSSSEGHQGTFTADDTRFLVAFSAQAAAAITGTGGCFDVASSSSSPSSSPPSSPRSSSFDGLYDGGLGDDGKGAEEKYFSTHVRGPSHVKKLGRLGKLELLVEGPAMGPSAVKAKAVAEGPPVGYGDLGEHSPVSVSDL